MRLDKFLAHAELGTRGRVRQLIRHGKVSVNGVKSKDPGFHVTDQDEVFFEGRRVQIPGPSVLAYYKPAGLITSTHDPQATIYSALPLDPKKFKPVGRLDKETEGLLLLTDDGDLNHALCSPRHHVQKEYVATLDLEVEPSFVVELKRPRVFANGEKIRGAIEAKQLGPREIQLVIDEGKYHQVRRMCLELGYQVTHLKRTRVGPISLAPLKIGEHRKLSEKEVQELHAAAKFQPK